MSTLKTRPKDAKFPKHFACTTIHTNSPSANEIQSNNPSHQKIHQKKTQKSQTKTEDFSPLLIFFEPKQKPRHRGQPRNRKPNRSPTPSNNLRRP
jgi:hypothetical protein